MGKLYFREIQGDTVIFHKLGLINKNQQGFTMLEVLIVAAVTTIITAASGTAIFHVFVGNTRSSNHVTAVSQVQSAGSWIDHDAHMAHAVDTDNTTANQFPLTLSWNDWSNNSNYQVVYTLANNDLYRDYSINGTSQGSSIIARYINDSDPALTICSYNSTEGILTVKLTATVGSGSEGKSVTRVYKTIPRPGN